MTATAQAIGHAVSKAAEVLPLAPKPFDLGQWWYDASGQVLGAAVGAIIAFGAGIYLLKRQIKSLNKAEFEKSELTRKNQIYQFFEDTEDNRKYIKENAAKVQILVRIRSAEDFPPFTTMIFDLYREYKQYRPYFKQEQIETIRRLYLAAREIYEFVDAYLKMREKAINREHPENFSAVWAELEPRLTRINNEIEKLYTYDPLSPTYKAD